MKSSSLNLRTLRIYFSETLKYKKLFYTTLIFWLVGISMQKLLLPLVIARVIDTITALKGPDLLDWSLFTKPLLVFISIAVVAQILIDVALVFLSRFESNVMVNLYDKIYSKLLRQSVNFHSNSFSGSLVSQSNRFLTGYVGITDTFVLNLTQLLIFVVLSSVVLMFYAPLIAITFVIWSLVFVSINIYLTIRRISLSRARAAADTKITGRLADSMMNINAIKTFSAEEFEKLHYHNLAQNRADKGYRYWIRSIQNDAVYGILMALLQLIILVVSIKLIMDGTLSIGTFLLAQVYIVQAIAYLWGLSNITKNVEQNLSDASEMTQILGLNTSVKDSKNPITPVIQRGSVEFKNITFFYEDDKKPLFNNFNLSIKPGEKIGLVGRSGSGKTTLSQLLLRFNDLSSGEILIDNHNIAEMKQADLRSNIACVPQEPLLFHRSIAENIAYGNNDKDDKQIEIIAKLSHSSEFISQLPNGLATMVGERGVKLSGGQRQRIAIARAMIKNAPILLLDEATSALDSESELLIQDALWKLMENRTAIVIAHRLSTIQKMDRIVVLDNGKIVEQGSHKELLYINGAYAKLWAHQSGGFIED